MCFPGVPRSLRVLLWLLFCTLTLTGVTVGAFYWLPASEHYSITESYQFFAGRHDASVYLVLLTPISGPYQDVSEPAIQWQGLIDIKDDRQLRVLALSGFLGGGSSLQAIVEYDVKLPQGSIRWEAPTEPFQLSPQKNVESDHPLFKEAAANLAGGTSRDDVRNILRFTQRHLVPLEERRPFTKASALRAYNTGVGCCGEYANLMVALCRAAGIPAQTIIGLLLPDLPPYSIGMRQTDHQPGDTHAWVEFHTDAGWELADPSRESAIFDRAQFGRSDGRHLSFGEAGRLAATYEEHRRLAVSHGEIIGEQLGTVKYIAAADTHDVSVTPSITLRKGWDGRWFNMVIAWIITTAVLWKMNLRYVRHHRSYQD